MNKDLNSLIEKALKGDKQALELVVETIKDVVYNLALKMLFFPEDAQDASQEILIRIITHLSSYKGTSSFKTWAYKVASNYLLTERSKKSRKTQLISFEEYALQIDTGQSEQVLHSKNEGETRLLEEEVKISCLHGLLHCLNASNRLIFILGAVLDFNSTEAAEILEISPASFRKQLSRSRDKVKNFLTTKCGLVNENNACRCRKKIDFLVDQGMINPQSLQFAKHNEESIDMMHKISTLNNTLSVFKSVSVSEAPPQLLKAVKQTINSTQF